MNARDTTADAVAAEPGAPAAVETMLELRQATKKYAGVPAIEAVDFTLRRGEIHALLGENGAGKSTLTKVMAGVVPLSAGQMLVEGRPVQLRTPLEARHEGIAMVFQETSLVPTMTVAQNLFLGQESFFNRLRGVYISAQQFLQSLNFDVDPTATVGMLGAAKKQMVEIARAVLHKARIIIFDEPTASLTPEEKKYFFDLVFDLKARGVSVIFISHALEEALLLADRITVLRDGRHVVTDDKANFDRERIVQAMVGARSLADALRPEEDPRAAAGRVPAVGAQPAHGGDGQEQLAVGVRGPDHGRVRPGGRGPHRDLQGGGRADQARLLPWRRDPAARPAGALPRGAPGGARRHRLHHRGPQVRGLLRDHVDRAEHLHGAAGQAGRRARAGVGREGAFGGRALEPAAQRARHRQGGEA
jgi:ABC-type multidrug transport system ATPase subunit